MVYNNIAQRMFNISNLNKEYLITNRSDHRYPNYNGKIRQSIINIYVSVAKTLPLLQDYIKKLLVLLKE